MNPDDIMLSENKSGTEGTIKCVLKPTRPNQSDFPSLKKVIKEKI
jgi:hypothetical protein